jgi:hypothetical protein
MCIVASIPQGLEGWKNGRMEEWRAGKIKAILPILQPSNPPILQSSKLLDYG